MHTVEINHGSLEEYPLYMCGPSGARGLLRGASSAAQLTAKDEVDLKVAGNPGALESTEYSEVTLLTGSDKR